jgi:hypothetical protein
LIGGINTFQVFIVITGHWDRVVDCLNGLDRCLDFLRSKRGPGGRWRGDERYFNGKRKNCLWTDCFYLSRDTDMERRAREAGWRRGNGKRGQIDSHFSQKSVKIGDKLSHSELMHGWEEVFGHSPLDEVTWEERNAEWESEEFRRFVAMLSRREVWI